MTCRATFSVRSVCGRGIFSSLLLTSFTFFAASSSSVSRPGDVPSDFGKTAIDSGKLLVSVPQFAANYGAMQADDTLAAGNQVVQNLPLPSWAKSLSNTATDHTITAINDVADFVTKPDDIKKAWNWATGWIH